jgi:glyoxylase-like metal-dependent hydrolase (beta-lactamase superfamily II)
MAPVEEKEYTTAALEQDLRQGEGIFLLDVRKPAEFEAWHIEGPRPVPLLNVPYSAMIDGWDRAQGVEAVKSYVPAHVGSGLPKDRRIVTVCARGITARVVSQGLRELGYDAVPLAGGMTAWGESYSFVPIVETPELSLHQVVRHARGCLGYVLASGSEAVIVDAARHTGQYTSVIRQRKLNVLFVADTHAHADHITGGPALARELGVPYYLHPYDAIHPMDVMAARMPFEFLRDDQEFKVGRMRLRVMHVPGHTLGNVAFVADEQFVLSGDSIFLRSIARPDLGGRGEAWAPLHHASLRRMMQLPATSLVLPGHFGAPSEADEAGRYAARLGDIMRTNEGLQQAQKEEQEFVRYILASLPRFPPQYIEIKRVNLALVEADEEKAAELELGKNVCALGKP